MRSLVARVRLFRLFGRAFHIGTALLAIGLLALLVAILYALTEQATLSLRTFGLSFVGGSIWDPVHNIYGAFPALVGTLLTSGLALLLAVPVALGVAIFLSDLAPVGVRNPLAILVDLSATIPSVIFGFFGLIVVVPIMRSTIEPALARTTGGGLLFSGTPIGVDVLTASVILAIMILPTIAAISRSAFQAIPRIQREAALSLGATRSETVRLAVLGPARSAVLGGILLGLGRALGETMAVTMLIGNRYQVPTSLFSQGQTIASQIVNNLASAQAPIETSALVELGLILFVITFLVNVVARLLIWRLRNAGSTPRRARTRGVRRSIALRSARSPGALPTRPSDPAPDREAIYRRAARRRTRRLWTHRGVLALTGACLVAAIAPLAAIIWVAARKGGAAIVQPTFYTATTPIPCNPATQTGCSIGGIGPAIQGTLLLLGLASALAIPLGILIGIYLSEYGRGRKLGTVVSFFADVMSGFPSILLGVFVFILFLRFDRVSTFSLLSGSVALGVLMIPLVTRATEEALKLVPASYREAALALGFPKHRVTLRVVLASARTAILTGVLLAVARAGGETAALVLTAEGSNFYATGLGYPVGSLTLTIYNLGLQSYPNWIEDAWGATLVLLIIMLAISLGARLVFRVRGTSEEGG
jgi:phosphate transport system permease protein